MALTGKKANVKISGSALSLTNESTTANGARTEYQITNTAKRVLDPTASITVQTSPDGTNWTTVSTGYKLDRLKGKAIFDTARAIGTQVRMSGSYLPMATAGEAKEYSWSIEASNEDCTPFQNEYIKRQQAQKDASASIGRYYIDNTFKDKIESGALVVLEFYINPTTIDLQMWAICASDEISGAVDGLIEESIEFEGTTDIDGRCVSV